MPVKTFAISVSSVIICACILAPTAIAKTYKWTDAQGTTHYTQTPPTGITAQELTLKTKPITSKADAEDGDEGLQVEQIPGLKDAKENTAAQKEDDTKVAKMRDENCLNAKHNLLVLDTNTRVRVKEGGDYRVLGADEQVKRAQKLRDQIKELCQ